MDQVHDSQTRPPWDWNIYRSVGVVDLGSMSAYIPVPKRSCLGLFGLPKTTSSSEYDGTDSALSRQMENKGHRFPLALHGLVDLHSPLFNQPPLHSPQCRSRCQSHGVSGIGHVMGDRFPMTRSEKQATKEGRPPCPPHVQSSCENLRCPDSGGSSTGMDDPSPHFLGRPAVTWCENRKPMLLHAER